MTANELIIRLKQKYNSEVENICCLEKTCLSSKRCDAYNEKHLLDFDKIKDAHSKGRQTPASVDGLMEMNDTVCFVELKSWENFFKYKSQASDEDIKNQVDSYNLKEKLEDSMLICKKELEKDDLFDNIPIVFVLATDISITEQPEFSLLHNLNALAHSSSTWKYEKCNKLSKEKLKNIDIDNITVHKIYLSCKDFDKELDSYFQA